MGSNQVRKHYASFMCGICGFLTTSDCHTNKPGLAMLHSAIYNANYISAIRCWLFWHDTRLQCLDNVDKPSHKHRNSMAVHNKTLCAIKPRWNLRNTTFEYVKIMLRKLTTFVGPCNSSVPRSRCFEIAFNSLAPGRFDCSLKLVNFILISTINILSVICEIAIRWMPQHLNDH